MFEVVHREMLAPEVGLLKIKAPFIAEKRKPGQFVMIQVHEEGERIPLTIADSDTAEGTITVAAQIVGKTTAVLCSRQVGDRLAAVVGPLGHPTNVEKVGTVVSVGGGIGIALAYPITRGFREAGNTVLSIIGARTRDLLIFEKEMKSISDRLEITTDDGSYGREGFVTDVLKEIVEEIPRIDLVLAVGPVVMMRAVCRVTEPHGIKTIVSLNPIMVDGTGMCGACRVTVGGEVRFACVHGPEFDGHQVDFDELLRRLSSYRDQETQSYHRCLTELKTKTCD